MGVFFHILMRVFTWTHGNIPLHPPGSPYVDPREYSFTSIWELLRAFIGQFFYIHLGVFTCIYGTIFFTSIWEFLCALVVLFCHIHLGVFTCIYETIFSHPYGSFYVHLWDHSFTSIWEFLRAFMGLFFHIHLGVTTWAHGSLLSHPPGSYVYLREYSFAST